MSRNMRLGRGKNAVPEEFQADFDEFMDEKDSDLSREIALLRTLYLEIRSILNTEGNKIVLFALQQLRAALQLDPEKEKTTLQVLNQFFSPKPLSLDDVTKLAGLLETISRVADRRKKIAEGYSLKVELNEEKLVKFLQVCVLPYLNREQRQLVVEKASNFRLDRALSTVPDPVDMRVFESGDTGNQVQDS